MRALPLAVLLASVLLLAPGVAADPPIPTPPGGHEEPPQPPGSECVPSQSGSGFADYQLYLSVDTCYGVVTVYTGYPTDGVACINTPSTYDYYACRDFQQETGFSGITVPDLSGCMGGIAPVVDYAVDCATFLLTYAENRFADPAANAWWLVDNGSDVTAWATHYAVCDLGYSQAPGCAGHA